MPERKCRAGNLTVATVALAPHAFQEAGPSVELTRQYGDEAMTEPFRFGATHHAESPLEPDATATLLRSESKASEVHTPIAAERDHAERVTMRSPRHAYRSLDDTATS